MKVSAALIVCAVAVQTSSVALAQNLTAQDLAQYRIVDLTHSFDEHTLYWPSRPPMKFELERLSSGETPGGWFYSSNRLCTPEHGGTHLDAPIHFHKGGQTAAQLPLEKLLAPGVRIDVTQQTSENRDYRLTRQDVLQFEKRAGQIPAKQYFGSESTEDASRLSFPSYGEEAAKFLVEERKVAMLGVDTPSIDYGRSKNFIVHRVTAAQNVAGLENLARLEQLPAKGFIVIALPMKIAEGSGGPVRVIALLPGRTPGQE
jgi:kynurenine formamidase